MIPAVLWKAKAAGIRLTELYPSAARPLADPPPGSGLKPVMGDFGPPLLGHTLGVLVDSLGGARRSFDKYGYVLWHGLMGRRVVMVGGPVATEAVLLDRDKAFSAEKGYGFLIGPFFRGGMLLRDFDEHLYHRRIMQQAFTRPRLIGYLDLTTPGIQRGLSDWKPAKQFPLYTSAKKVLLELATEVFMGSELGPEAKVVERAFEDAVQGGQAVVRANVPGGVWARGLRGRHVLKNYFRRELPAKRAGDGTDLFSVLCRTKSEEGHTFSDDDIVNHMIFVMMAAHDTSTIALSMMAYLIGKHPEWQDRLRAESFALGKETLEYDDLERLPSLDLVFKETLRMYAPVGQQVREAVKDTEILGHYIPAKTTVIIGSYPSMRMEAWWPHPDEFDPERFAEHRREDKVHRFAWSPFGGGAHKCIGLYFGGMTVKAIMHQMLLHYRWTVPADYEVPLGWGTGPTPVDGLPIDLFRLTAADRLSARRTA
ncbi:cytochrome P450 [Antrihabitans stalactiti]|uniref:Cytochrome P450 n=1 Tax=Antrihabitans stalactiti TaxID=2584121 RepID=A0A848KC88_9NOCA|nr:cytochrome P450 [Antrihabitans stalactiti]NMN95939.1 cytochrome P450 [Antrihabitans stalactiti]